MKLVVSYRKEDSVVAILIIIIIIQWLGVRMKRKRKPGRKGNKFVQWQSWNTPTWHTSANVQEMIVQNRRDARTPECLSTVYYKEKWWVGWCVSPGVWSSEVLITLKNTFYIRNILFDFYSYSSLLIYLYVTCSILSICSICFLVKLKIVTAGVSYKCVVSIKWNKKLQTATSVAEVRDAECTAVPILFGSWPFKTRGYIKLIKATRNVPNIILWRRKKKCSHVKCYYCILVCVCECKDSIAE